MPFEKGKHFTCIFYCSKTTTKGKCEQLVILYEYVYTMINQ